MRMSTVFLLRDRVQSAVLRLHVVRLFVYDVGGLWSHRLELKSWKLIARAISPIPSLRSPKVIHLFPGEHGEISGRITLNMSIEYVDYCVFIGRRTCAPVVSAINIGKSYVLAGSRSHDAYFATVWLHSFWYTATRLVLLAKIAYFSYPFLIWRPAPYVPFGILR